MENKKQNPIQIKPANRGKFTKHCKARGFKGVTNECIEEGLASKSASVRKQAQFAKNAKSWKH